NDHCNNYKRRQLGSHRQRRTTRMKANTNRRRGFTLVEIMIVVAIIGMLASIAVPNFMKARTMARQKSCISNLQSIDGAIETWATDLNKAEGQPVTYNDIRTYLK